MLRQTIKRNVAPTNVKRLFRLSDCAISGAKAETGLTKPASPTAHQVYQSFGRKRKKDQPKNSSTGLLSKESAT
jgi:hypothetical protein